MAKVFLGGTCNGSLWRQQLIPQLKVGYFDPVVDDWNDEAYRKELFEREHSDFCLYVLTPKLTGFYSIAELIDDSNKRSEKTLFAYMDEDDGARFNTHQIKSLQRIGEMVEQNGAKWFRHIPELVVFLNGNKD